MDLDALLEARAKVASPIAAPSMPSSIDNMLEARASQPRTGSLVSAIPAGPGADQYSPDPADSESLLDKYVRGPLEATASTVSGLVAAPIGQAAGVLRTLTSGKFGTPEGIRLGEDTANNVTSNLQFQPRGSAGQRQAQTVGTVLGNTIPLGGLTGELSAIGRTAPAAFGSTKAQLAPIIKNELSPEFKQPALGASMGSAGTSLDSMFASSTPEMGASYQQAKRTAPIDPFVAKNHLIADSLPEPIRLTEGQATQDIHILSDEQNRRATQPGLADRFNQQNEQLKRNLDLIKDSAAPDVFATNHVESGQAMIDAYKAKDKALRAQIGVNYQALRDANGGNFPIDAKAFVANADALLKKDMASEFVPSPIAKQIESFKKGAPMSFEQFEAMRTNLASEMRKASRAGDGSTEHAAGLVRQALEDVPLSPEAAQLKPLADAARASAKARFDLLKKDPAYKAVVNETVAPDNFVQKFVINGKVDNVKLMRSILADDPAVSQHISAATINWLKQKAGIIDGHGNFSQAGFNKALESIRPKLGDLVGAEALSPVTALGDVARLTQAQPRGSYVNNSGTFVAGAKAAAAGAVEGAANYAAQGLPLGTWVRKSMLGRSEAKKTAQTLSVGAGLLYEKPKP